jgi:NADH-quinone oxidoreductase subunit F
VCHHPCETKCRAGQGGESIAIRALKRAAIEYSTKRRQTPKKRRKSQTRVAIIGSGPAGLMAGHDLSHKGYAPTIFEALPVAGVMLAVGIPDYRLPENALREDIDRVRHAGVEIKTNQKLGRDFSLEQLFDQGYKAVFVAIGAHKSMKLGIPNEETAGVIPAMKFLTSTSLGEKTNIGPRVGVIGGGNSAVDAARVANRLSHVEEVTIIYRRTRNEMPAYAEEIEAALEEGINIQFLTAPSEIIVKDGHITGIRCTRMELGTVDASGRRRPVPIKGSEYVVELDTLVSAISEQPDISFLEQDHNFEISGWNTFVVNSETLMTNVPGVFAGGDAIRGPSSVIEAMADGKRVANAIDQYLRNGEIKFEYTVTRPSVYVEPAKLTVSETLESTRQETKKLDITKRTKKFLEVDLGLSRNAAIKEAKRCLRCDLEIKDEDEKEPK